MSFVWIESSAPALFADEVTVFYFIWLPSLGGGQMSHSRSFLSLFSFLIPIKWGKDRYLTDFVCSYKCVFLQWRLSSCGKVCWRSRVPEPGRAEGSEPSANWRETWTEDRTSEKVRHRLPVCLCVRQPSVCLCFTLCRCVRSAQISPSSLLSCVLPLSD